MVSTPEHKRSLRVAVIAVTSKLTHAELVLLDDFTRLGRDPRQETWYEKVSVLFTESNGTRMRSEALDALAEIMRRNA